MNLKIGNLPPLTEEQKRLQKELSDKFIHKNKTYSISVAISLHLKTILTCYSKVFFDGSMSRTIRFFLFHGIRAVDNQRKQKGLESVIEVADKYLAIQQKDMEQEIMMQVKLEQKTLAAKMFSEIKRPL